MKTKVIQILGLARSGKDWTASQLKTYFESQSKSVEIMSYAAPMKRITTALFGISLKQLNEYKNKSDRYSINLIDRFSGEHGFNTNFRTLLQKFGNKAMKSEFGDSVWSDLMLTNINQSSADIIIISDCRFTVELNSIGGTTIRVINFNLTSMNHQSETELLDAKTDYCLNNTNYQLTTKQINELAEKILKEKLCK